MPWLLIVTMSFGLTACSGDTTSSEVSGAVSWAQAQRLLRDCQVKGIEQTHSRLVTLTLRSGSSAFTHEPHIDDIYPILNRLPRKCGPRTVATE
jgi:hypothetical protein